MAASEPRQTVPVVHLGVCPAPMDCEAREMRCSYPEPRAYVQVAKLHPLSARHVTRTTALRISLSRAFPLGLSPYLKDVLKSSTRHQVCFNIPTLSVAHASR